MRNSTTRQAGFINPLTLLTGPWLNITIGIAILAAFAGTYWYGDHNGSKRIQERWNAKIALEVITADIKRHKDVAATALIIRENLDLQERINKVQSEIAAKEYKNETNQFCKAAPAGSILLTPERLRNFTTLYKSGSVR